MQPPSILVYGREPVLLQSRHWVFEVAGFRVASAANLAKARQIAQREPIDLLVLCHTLSKDEYREAVAWADSLPGLKRIVLLPAGAPCSEVSSEEVLNQLAGPRELVAAAHRLLPVLQAA